MPKASPVIIVLSQLDSRFFKFVDGVTSLSNTDFCVYKIDESDVKGASSSPTFCQRSVSCELDLDAGSYVVYVSPILLNISQKTSDLINSLGLTLYMWMRGHVTLCMIYSCQKLKSEIYRGILTRVSRYGERGSFLGC